MTDKTAPLPDNFVEVLMSSAVEVCDDMVIKLFDLPSGMPSQLEMCTLGEVACTMFYGCPYNAMPAGCNNCPFDKMLPEDTTLRRVVQFMNSDTYPDLYLLTHAPLGMHKPVDLGGRIQTSKEVAHTVYALLIAQENTP